MSEERITSLEVRVSVIEGQVREIRDGQKQLHDDLKENTIETRKISHDTRQIVEISMGLKVIAKVTIWVAGIFGGFYAALRLAHDWSLL